ncbi:hypothetical protein B0H12DRAFT_1156817, partial [Mycena haematopus]
MAHLLLPCPLSPSSCPMGSARPGFSSTLPLWLPATSSSWSSPRHTGPASSRTAAFSSNPRCLPPR